MLRARQSLGKYRIIGRIATGPMADVYRAFDTIHKTRVALKIPKADQNVTVDDFLHEVQVAVNLQHPNILAVQNASYIDNHFVIAMELGEESLAHRMERRMSTARALHFAEQALAALAFAHENKVIHCDIKPENYILFADNSLKLADFGFAKISLRTLKASGSGTIDYIAPEQAMGRPKFQSDVFSVGLVLYRLLSGKLPEWPFSWPMVGHDRLKTRVGPELSDVLRRAIQLDPADRYKDAIHMYAAFRRVKDRTRRQRKSKRRNNGKTASTWRQLQWREFQRQFKKGLDTRHTCRRCEGPVAENMHACPWCGFDNPSRGATTTMPAHLSALRTRRKAGLELLCVVLRSRIPAGDQQALPGQTLCRQVFESALPGTVDGAHALLPVVPGQGEKGLENSWQPAEVFSVQEWCCTGLLELLRVVPRTGGARTMRMLDSGATPEQLEIDVCGGTIVAYTSRAPDKETDNEDCVAVIPYGQDAAVLVVADGAGGMPAGRRASNHAVNSLNESLQKAAAQDLLLRTAILNGIEEANSAVLGLANGSATTMTVLSIEGIAVRTFQIGDSEALVSGQRGRVKAQTMAHSPTGFAVEAGFLDERDALHHEERHLVSNLMGTPEMRIDIGAAVDLAPLDTVLVASDGLTDNLHMSEIIELIRKRSAAGCTRCGGEPCQAADDNANRCHQPSKPDDLSIILFRRTPQNQVAKTRLTSRHLPKRQANGHQQSASPRRCSASIGAIVYPDSPDLAIARPRPVPCRLLSFSWELRVR